MESHSVHPPPGTTGDRSRKHNPGNSKQRANSKLRAIILMQHLVPQQEDPRNEGKQCSE